MLNHRAHNCNNNYNDNDNDSSYTVSLSNRETKKIVSKALKRRQVNEVRHTRRESVDQTEQMRKQDT